MKFNDYMKLLPQQKLKIFLNSLLITNRTKEYYNNWNKIIENTKKYEIELNIMNYLLGKQNIYEECLNLFKKYPETIKLIPVLIAVREEELSLLSFSNDKKYIEKYDFINIDKNVEKYVKLMNDIGLLNFLKNNITTSLIDYIYGVEVGLDTNGRKNRSGTIMENILYFYIDKICKNNRYKHKSQATAKYIKETWGIIVNIDKSERKFDEVIYDSLNDTLTIIETNYFGSSGTKLKSVCGEFVSLKNLVCKNEKVKFVWITDGTGWLKSHKPMLEAFGKLENIFNLDMLEKGYLEKIL